MRKGSFTPDGIVNVLDFGLAEPAPDHGHRFSMVEATDPAVARINVVMN